MTHCHPSHQKHKKHEKEASSLIQYAVPAVIVGALLGGVALAVFLKDGGPQGASLNDAVSSDGTARLAVEPMAINLGTVPMSQGVVERTFSVKNTGDGALRISGLQTSCMCTSAQLEVSGEKSPVFGMAGHSGGHHGGAGAAPKNWFQDIPPGGEGILRIFYDPNAHGPTGVGPFERMIDFKTNDSANPQVSLKISGTVVR